MTNRQRTDERRILRPRHVAEMLGISLVTIWRMRRRGEFPAPIQLSPGSIGWRLADIERWLVQRQCHDYGRSGS